MDGEADFRRLSNEELARAKANADPVLNPLDWENVRKEFKRRGAKRRVKLTPIMVRVVGWYLLAGCAIGAFVLFGAASTLNALFVAACTVALAVWGIGGALLIARKRLGLWVGIGALALQLPTIQLAKVAYHFKPIYGIGAGLIDSSLDFQLYWGTHFLVRIDGSGGTVATIDLVAVYGITILLRSMRRASRVS
jgi:hypothetical protein